MNGQLCNNQSCLDNDNGYCYAEKEDYCNCEDQIDHRTQFWIEDDEEDYAFADYDCKDSFFDLDE